MKKTIKRIVATFLVAVMLFGSAPIETLTGFDFGSLFEVGAEAATIYDDGFKITGVLPNEAVYFETRSEYTLWEKVKKLFGAKIKIEADIVIRIYGPDQAAIDALTWNGGPSLELKIYEKVNNSFIENKTDKLAATKRWNTKENKYDYYLSSTIRNTAIMHYSPSGAGRTFKFVINDKTLKDNYSGPWFFTFESRNDDAKFISAVEAKEYYSPQILLPYTGGDNEFKVTESVKFVNPYSKNLTGTSAQIGATITNPDKVKIQKYGYTIYPTNNENNYFSKTIGRNINNYELDITANIENGSQGNVSIVPVTNYKYLFWAETDMGYTQSSVMSFKTPLVKPSKTSFSSVKAIDYRSNAEINSTDLGIGDNISIKWNSSDYADYYTLSINGVEDTTKIYGTSKVLNFDTDGVREIKVRAHNSVGSSDWSNAAKVTVHPDVKVTFYKDGNVYQENTLTWGHDLDKIPETPHKKGHTFKGWYNEDITSIINFNYVKDDNAAYAGYNISKFEVQFVGPDGESISSQIVEYGKSAIAPDEETIEENIEDGRVFVGWNKDFSYVTEKMIVTAVTDAENKELPIEITNASATRYEKNYAITCTVSNDTLADVEHGRVIVALKTAEGKLVTTSESAAFFLDAKHNDINSNIIIDSKNLEIIVPIIDKDNNKQVTATKADIYAVKDYQTVVPISVNVETAVVDRDPWSEPTTEIKEGYDLSDETQVQHYVEYRSRNIMQKSTTSATERDRLVNEEGWTFNSSATTTHKDTNSGTWTTKKPTSGTLNEDYAEKTVTDKAATTVYRYKTYRYWNPSTGSYWYSYGRGWADSMGYSGKWYYKELSSPMSKTGTVDGYNKYDYSGDGYVWFSNGSNNKTNPAVSVAAVTHKEYRVFDTIYTYYLSKWPDTFSDWTRTFIQETDTLDVDTRDVYRYKAADIGRIEDTTGEVRAEDEFLLGDIGEEYAGRQAILYIYKINEASDWTLEHIDQTLVLDDGTYEFSPFKLREEPSDITGDMTVMIGIEGCDNAIYVDTIEAPKPFNKVTFVDDLTGDVISVQDVYEGEDATVPEAPEHEGYTFSHWNNSSSNINGDLEIRAVYDKNVYTVVWIDYVQEKYEMETYEHGADLIPPYGLIESSEYVPAGWEGYIPDTHIPITSNMVIAAQYDYRTFTVDFLDFNGDVIESQTIKYGETPEFPEFDYGNVENTIFFGFGCIEEYLENAGSDELETNSVSVEANETQIGTSTEEEESEFIMLEDYKVYNNCQIVPKFEFAETTATPTIDISTGTYSEAKTVTIECETESALIFYTLDGSDPATSETAIECASPAVITIEDSCQLRYYASAFNMNASDECREWYAINDGDETNKYIVKFAAYDEDTVGYTGIAEKDSKLNAELISAIEGYTFIGAYSSVDVSIDEEMGEVTDAAYSDEWNFATDTVTGDTTLYLKYDINTYTVDFIDYDGFYLDSQTVEYGESAVAPEVPARDGYVFTGWDTDEYLTVTDNMEVNAVYVPEDEYVTVSLSKSNYTMMSGNSFKLNATTGGNVENPAIAWVSTDENVAVVDDSGTVTATDKGTVEIYAIVVDNGETAKCTITIVGNPSDELCLTGSSYLTVSENYVLGFDITTENDNHHAEMVAEIKTHFSSANLVFTNINGEELADTDYVGTGTQIILMDGETIVDTLTAVVSGDMDGDGYVTNRDAARVNRYLVDKENPTEDQLYAMDVNADGYVNNRDASLVSRFLVGKEKI